MELSNNSGEKKKPEATEELCCLWRPNVFHLRAYLEIIFVGLNPFHTWTKNVLMAYLKQASLHMEEPENSFHPVTRPFQRKVPK